MYLNEKSWHEKTEDLYLIDMKIRKFLDVYAEIKRKNSQEEIFVPEEEKLYINSESYSLGQWLNATDKEYQRLYLSFWNKRVTYKLDDDYEVRINDEILKGGTESWINDSCMLSIELNEKWKEENIEVTLISVVESNKKVKIRNVSDKEHLENENIKKLFIVDNEVKSYNELWEKRGELFPHLSFCPSVEGKLKNLQVSYLNQVTKKLVELEDYCVQFPKLAFDPSKLTKTTTESGATLEKFEKEHTFKDEDGKEYLASWHMRFTGIPGRIFFIPNYNDDKDKILICYIGEKLRNVSYT